jgi:hypothetical protein
MFLRIAPRQVEQVYASEIRHILLWVEESLNGETIQGLLIEERETLGISRHECNLFPS